MQDFIRWNHRTAIDSPPRLIDYLTSEAANHGRFYLLSDLPIPSTSSDLIQLIGHVSPGYDGQHFYFYVIGPSLAEAHPDLPACVLDKRPLIAARVTN
jgi:hypothetical protein